jgi:glycosyltransferase involved in cell wall biosynthesis
VTEPDAATPDTSGADKPLRVLVLCYEFPPVGGGGANAASYILKQFADRPDLQVDFVTSSAHPRDEVEPFASNVQLHRLNVKKKRLHYWTQPEVLRWLWRAWRYVGRMDLASYDVCHAIFGFPSGMVSYLKRSRLPYIVSLRGSDVPGFNDRFNAQYIVLKPIFRRIWRNAARVVTNSDGLRDLALQTAELPIDMIPNGVDTRTFTPGQPFEQDALRLICVSRLIGRKCVDYLIRAMPDIIRERPGARLMIYGEGNIRQQLVDLARELDLEERVVFVGRVPREELPECYRAADIFVLPSKNEGMSNAMLEAVASGLPVVGTSVGGNDVLVRDGENGVLVPPEDTAALADAVLRISKDPEAARQMGRRSREIAEEMTWRNVADAYVDLYRASAKRENGRNE